MARKALLLVDVQYDFLPPDGSLAVADGDAVLPQIYELLSSAGQYDIIVASMDYHPVGHISFASTHLKEPFKEIRVPKLNTQGETIAQMLWPDHCVQNTTGCKIEKGVQSRLDALDPNKVEYIRKGTLTTVDAYSAFSDNAYSVFTPLAKILHQRGVEEVDVVGLALDYCVKFTAIDSQKFGFETRVLMKATRAVAAENVNIVLKELRAWGVQIVE